MGGRRHGLIWSESFGAKEGKKRAMTDQLRYVGEAGRLWQAVAS